ncbi:MAG: thioredoxin [Streptosporangiaceae bacterium]
MTEPSSDFSLHGAVDLGARRAAADQQARRAEQASGGGRQGVIDATEDSFNTDVVERSRSVPVVIDFWASWCEPCKQLSPILEKLAGEAQGAWTLAKVDVDANQRLAQALQVQSLPTVVAVVDGQVVNGFMGALPEAQVREWVGQLMDAVGQARAEAGGEQPVEEEQGEPSDPDLAEALAAADRGDFEAAAGAYRRILDRSPGDPMATSGLAQADLLRRATTLDESAVRRDAAAAPDDVRAQCAVADLDMVSGRVEDAFDRLVGLVRRTGGEDRDAARVHLLGLFDVVPPDDPRVKRARSALASALF